MEMKFEQERLVTVTEIAELLGVKESWVYGRTCVNDIPHVRVGRYVRFSVPDVMKWLQSASELPSR